MKAIDVANFFIDLYNSVPEGQITNLSLNKLLYFAQGHSLAENGKQLFDEPIEAWKYGPVVPSVYRTFKQASRKNIAKPCGNYSSDVFSEEDLDLLLDVFRKYQDYSASALLRMTHKEGTPWRQVFQEGENNVISQESLKRFFSYNRLPRISLAPIDVQEPKRNADGYVILPPEWDDDED